MNFRIRNVPNQWADSQISPGWTSDNGFFLPCPGPWFNKLISGQIGLIGLIGGIIGLIGLTVV